MRIIALLVLATGLAFGARAENSPTPYEWVAVDRDGNRFEGEGEASRMREAWGQIARGVDELARRGECLNKTVFRVTFVWKGRRVTRYALAWGDRPSQWSVFDVSEIIDRGR